TPPALMNNDRASLAFGHFAINVFGLCRKKTGASIWIHKFPAPSEMHMTWILSGRRIHLQTPSINDDGVHFEIRGHHSPYCQVHHASTHNLSQALQVSNRPRMPDFIRILARIDS
ncbi:hypothetical protein, partial [Pseudomonas coronafaciens]|uniref:hypothetical protein n=1 Tax=Pseudomonas coronafaciens TaxID=53409 RepID=UPI001C81C70A